MSDEAIDISALQSLVTSVFETARTSRANAESVARALVQAEIDGQAGHGLSRVPSYTAQSLSGKVDGNATPSVTFLKPGAATVDAAHGFAYPAIDLIVRDLPAACRTNGIAAATISRSHHCGAAGLHVERMAEAGLVALFFANTPKAMAPWGGRSPLFGTNPIAFAAPRRDSSPIVIDMALSEVARGKILTAAQKGEPIPEGWAVDAEGRPTTDAQAALAGTLMPIGGAKGAALALMVELLAVTLGGANFATEATSFFDAEGDPPGVGQLMIAIDPSAFAGQERVLDRVETLAQAFANNGDARLPGSTRRWRRQEAHVHGVKVAASVLADLRARASGS
ncbi:MAG: Ldh family oxidoreductase [Pseudomonadota bacterium]